MGSWIKIDADLTEKPEVCKCARVLQTDRFAVAGRLLALWGWCDAHTEDGRTMLGTSDVDRICGMRGFAAALVSVGWLEVDEATGDVTIPLFSKHNGATAKRRASVAASVRKSRNKKEQEQTDEGRKTKCNHQCKQPCLQNDYLDKIRNRDNIISRVSYDMCRKPPPKAEVAAAMGSLMTMSGGTLSQCVDAYLDSRQAAGWLNAKGLSIVDWRADARAFARVYAERNTNKKQVTRRHDCNNPNDYRTN